VNYEHCRVKHDPPHTYGDCLRACVASVMELDYTQVSHFMHDNPEPSVAMQRLRDWLAPFGEAPFIMHLPGEPLELILDHMAQLNPTSVYLLFGGTRGGGGHVVVCKGGKIEWNPSWTDEPLIGPGAGDVWQVMVLGRV